MSSSKRSAAIVAAVTTLTIMGAVVIVYGIFLRPKLREAMELDFIPRTEYVLVPGVGLLLAAALVYRVRSRSVGWMVAGSALVPLFWIGHVMVSPERDPMVSEGRPWFAARPIETGLIACVTLLLVLAVVEALIAEREKAASEMHAQTSLTAEKKRYTSAQEAASEEAAKRERERNAEIANWKGLVDEARRQRAEDRAWRPYESQLVAAFTLSLGATWQRELSGQPFGLNHYQGNLDREFGDFIGQAQGWCWLVELKRDRTSVASEFKKLARIDQHKALKARADQRLTAIANRCHWLGWGVTEGNEAGLQLNPYWANWPKGRIPERVVKHNEFACQAFSKPSTHPVGAAPQEFADYLLFLSEQAGGSESQDDDIIGAFVFHQAADGAIRWWLEPNIVSVAARISMRVKEIETNGREQAQRETAEKELQRQKNSPDPGFGIS